MRFLVLIPGKLRRGPVQALFDDYAQRCRRLSAPLSLECVREEPERKGGPPRELALEREAKELLARVPAGYRRVVLDEHGDQPSSPELARRLDEWRTTGVRGVAFLVGSARGIGASAVAAADLRLSLSRMTFPHELVLPLLAEQLYRSMSILNGLPYHR